MSIALKTSVLFTFLFGVIMAAAVIFLTQQFSARESHFQKMDRVSSFLADRIEHEGTDFNFTAFAASNDIYIEIYDRQAGTVVSYGKWPQNGFSQEDISGHVRSRTGSDAILRVADLDFSGGLTLPQFLVGLAVLLIFAAFSGALILRRMMRPVQNMTRAAREISAKDLSRRIEPGRSNDELRELAETFNEMLDRIEEAYELQKRFVSDASHELRTPLSVISGYANLLRRWGGKDEAIRSEAVTKILEETDDMQSLVERLLFLARADRQSQPLYLEVFSASGLMEEIAAETRTADHTHTVESRIASEVELMADRALMKQAVRAVVDNSVKYTPTGGTIRLSCRREGGRAVLGVEDTGVGISAEALPHIFERFYKADFSRSREGKSSSGLGLSIVKWIVERHGGEIRVTSGPGKGTKTEITLPLNQQKFLPTQTSAR